jgi:hypothetical protein
MRARGEKDIFYVKMMNRKAKVLPHIFGSIVAFLMFRKITVGDFLQFFIYIYFFYIFFYI